MILLFFAVIREIIKLELNYNLILCKLKKTKVVIYYGISKTKRTKAALDLKL